MIYNISNSEKLRQDYLALLQKVRNEISAQDKKQIGVDKSKMSRVLNEEQADFFVLAELASICGIDCELRFKTR